LSPTSPSPLPQLEGLATTFGRYFNLYVIYIDYFHYMRSLSHEHQPRGAGGVLEDQFILDDEVLSGARERRLEDATTTFGHDDSNCIGRKPRLPWGCTGGPIHLRRWSSTRSSKKKPLANRSSEVKLPAKSNL